MAFKQKTTNMVGHFTSTSYKNNFNFQKTKRQKRKHNKRSRNPFSASRFNSYKHLKPNQTNGKNPPPHQIKKIPNLFPDSALFNYQDVPLPYKPTPILIPDLQKLSWTDQENNEKRTELALGVTRFIYTDEEKINKSPHNITSHFTNKLGNALFNRITETYHNLEDISIHFNSIYPVYRDVKTLISARIENYPMPTEIPILLQWLEQLGSHINSLAAASFHLWMEFDTQMMALEENTFWKQATIENRAKINTQHLQFARRVLTDIYNQKRSYIPQQYIPNLAAFKKNLNIRKRTHVQHAINSERYEPAYQRNVLLQELARKTGNQQMMQQILQNAASMYTETETRTAKH